MRACKAEVYHELGFASLENFVVTGAQLSRIEHRAESYISSLESVRLDQIIQGRYFIR